MILRILRVVSGIPREVQAIATRHKVWAGIVIVLALLAVVIYLPRLPLVGPRDGREAESDFRGHLLQALAGLVLAAGAIYTARTFELNRKKQDAERKERNIEFELIRERQDAEREGQITERFTRAVEQLANRDNRDIRLGGIYALERIAWDSKTHYEPAMEVLTAFLREHARWSDEGAVAAAHASDQPRKVPEPDVQAAATVVGRRNRSHQRKGYRLVLRGVDLRGAKLREADLQEARFENAHLEQADLRGAKLEKAHLQRTHLEGAKLDWPQTRLDYARMEGVHLKGASLTLAHMEGANLSPREEGADRFEAHLEETDLRGAHLERANLSEARLERADLSGAHLERANLSGAHLGEAKFHRTFLFGVDLSQAIGLTQEQLDHGYLDDATKLPQW